MASGIKHWPVVRMRSKDKTTTAKDLRSLFYVCNFPASRGLSRRGKNERKERVSLLSLIFASRERLLLAGKSVTRNST